MTFIEALNTGRPIRRASSVVHRPWIHLGEERCMSGNVPRWRRIDTGEAVGLHAYDYQADDWEVMP